MIEGPIVGQFEDVDQNVLDNINDEEVIKLFQLASVLLFCGLEDFGLVPVEAMASGLVPVVISQGGIPEIVDHGVNGFLWKTIDELVSKTQKLIDEPDTLKRMSEQSLINCQQFSKNNFEKKLISIINQ
jgi:glycosyltransferase involved in cell wall biosynthesis